MNSYISNLFPSFMKITRLVILSFFLNKKCKIINRGTKGVQPMYKKLLQVNNKINDIPKIFHPINVMTQN